jgi:channel protein (hemolysin III family)
VHVYLFRGPWRWGMLAGIWTLALAGAAMKMLYFSEIPEWLGLLFYLGLGWLGLVSWTMLLRRHGFQAVRVALWGALAYTSGALVDFLRWPELVPQVIGAHELFHLAVLAGIALHWTFIYGFAVREPAGAAARIAVRALPAA